MKITITKLVNPMHVGDWHDAPLKWTVNGPYNEVQHFETKKNALRYVSIRRKTSDPVEINRQYVHGA